MATKVEWRPDGIGGPAQFGYALSERIPRCGVPVLGRSGLLALLDQSTARRMTLICAPAGAGKTVACSAWAAARAHTRQAAWITLRSAEDQAWFWACLYSRLRRTSALAEDAANLLEDGPAGAFALRLVEAARVFRVPVVIVLDNADFVSDGAVLRGLALLARHAPPFLRLVLCARQPPAMDLDRLRSRGDLAEISAADLAAAASYPESLTGPLPRWMSPGRAVAGPRQPQPRTTPAWRAARATRPGPTLDRAERSPRVPQ